MLENGSPNNPTMRPFIKDGTISGRDAEKIAAYVYHINQETPPVKVEQGGASPQGEEVKWENKLKSCRLVVNSTCQNSISININCILLTVNQ
jgi:hypothetical protein